MACIACAGEHDRPDFDYCRCCGYGEPVAQSATNKPVPESDLARAIRQARGTFEPEDVPTFLKQFGEAKARAALPRKDQA